MSIHTIFNRILRREEPKQGNFHELSFMKDVREAASRKVTDAMSTEERMEHARYWGPIIHNSHALKNDS